MRAPALLVVLALLFTAACNNNSVRTTTPVTPTTPTASFAGTWVGTATDSSGSMMGSGFGNSANMTWVLTQSGTQVSGTMSFAGMTLTPGISAPMVTGTVSGNTMSFSMTLAAGTMAPPNTACSATANGTMTMNATGNSMSGTYSGSSSCIGGFANGQITLTRQ